MDRGLRELSKGVRYINLTYKYMRCDPIFIELLHVSRVRVLPVRMHGGNSRRSRENRERASRRSRRKAEKEKVSKPMVAREGRERERERERKSEPVVARESRKR